MEALSLRDRYFHLTQGQNGAEAQMVLCRYQYPPRQRRCLATPVGLLYQIEGIEQNASSPVKGTGHE